MCPLAHVNGYSPVLCVFPPSLDLCSAPQSSTWARSLRLAPPSILLPPLASLSREFLDQASEAKKQQSRGGRYAGCEVDSWSDRRTRICIQERQGSDDCANESVKKELRWMVDCQQHQQHQQQPQQARRRKEEVVKCVCNSRNQTHPSEMVTRL